MEGRGGKDRGESGCGRGAEKESGERRLWESKGHEFCSSCCQLRRCGHTHVTRREHEEGRAEGVGRAGLLALRDEGSQARGEGRVKDEGVHVPLGG